MSGLGDGLFAWFGRDFDEVNRFLASPTDSEGRALACTLSGVAVEVRQAVEAGFTDEEKTTLRRLRRAGGEQVFVAKGAKARRLHKAFLRYHDPANWPLLREALHRLGRADLIGSGPDQLVPLRQPSGHGAPAQPTRGARPFRTQHTRAEARRAPRARRRS